MCNADFQARHGWCTLNPTAAGIACTRPTQDWPCQHPVIKRGRANGFPPFPEYLYVVIVGWEKIDFLQWYNPWYTALFLKTILMKALGHKK